jgi:excisionase family DNA binding protein
MTAQAAAAKPITVNWAPGTRTLEELKRSGPPTLSPEQTAPYLGVGRSTIYAAIAANEFPVKVIRVKRRLRVVTASLIALLEDTKAAGPAA